MILLKPYFDFQVSSEQLENYNIKSFFDDYITYSKSHNISFCNNQASAVHLSLRALGLRRGDRVICNISSDIRVVNAIRYFDAEPIFIDSNLDSFSIDYNLLEELIITYNDKKIKVLIVDMPTSISDELDKIQLLANKYDIKIIFYLNTLISDNPKVYQGDITIFGSYNQIASIGILQTNNKILHNKIELLKNQAIVTQNGDFIDITDIGYEYNTNIFNQYYYHQYLSKIIQPKDVIALNYSKTLFNIEEITLLKNIDMSSPFYYIRVHQKRSIIISNLEKNGIEVGIGKPPVTLFGYYKTRYKLKITSFPNANLNYQELIALPFYPQLTITDITKITSIIKESLGS